MRDCHSIVGLYTYQNRVPFAPSLRWVSCKERDRLPHEGANFHSSFVHYRKKLLQKFTRAQCLLILLSEQNLSDSNFPGAASSVTPGARASGFPNHPSRG